MFDVDVDDGIATIRLDHGSVNAMDLELLQAVTGEIRGLDHDDAVRAIVLTGNGRAFCAGVDLRRFLDGGADYGRPFLAALGNVFVTVLRAATPVVAAVDGHAIAGGAILAASCDHVVCTDDAGARIGLSELAVGVPFPAAPLEIMRRRLGRHVGEAVLLAGLYAPPEALARGFVDEVVAADDLLDRARAVADRLGGIVPGSFALTKQALNQPVEAAMAAHGEDWDDRVADTWLSEPVQAAIADFMERTTKKG